MARFRRSLSNPRLADREGASNNYALALEKTGNPAEAMNVYAGLVAGGTQRPEICLNFGNLLLKTGNRDEAESMFRNALAMAPAGSAYSAYAGERLRKIVRRR